MTRRPAAALVLILAAIGLCGACNNNDGGMSGAPCIEFVADATPVPGAVTAAVGRNSSCDVAVVDLIVSGVDDLFAASFDIQFDPTRVSLITVSTSNSVLGSDGAPVLRNVVSVASGRITIGLSRGPASMGVDVDQAATLTTLTFLRQATGGTTTLSFVEPKLLDSSESPTEIPGISFVGGTFRIFTSSAI